MSTFSDAATPTCKAEIRKSLEILSQRRAGVRAPARKTYNFACWREVPELYRRMITAAAGLSHDVAKKVDRDLTEEEKAKLRAAASHMHTWLSPLVSL